MNIKGHCVIKDADGNIVFDGYNDVHPGNMARMIARGLANENNYWINSIRFGNLGTYNIDTVLDNEDPKKFKTISSHVHRSPNDGIDPDYSGWQSKLYNEIYREYLDDHYPTTVGTGKNSDASNDPPSFEHSVEGCGVVSLEDSKSKVIINCCLNINEPSNQMVDGGVFKFDEIALFTGLTNVEYSGYQLVNVCNNFDKEDTGLLVDTKYAFDIMVGENMQHVEIITPKVGTGTDGKISYYDLVSLLNNMFDDIDVDMITVNKNTIIPFNI